jgi:hypothetical protein
MRLRRFLPSLLTCAFTGMALGTVMTGCANLDVTNPNQPSTGTFWKTQADATQGVTAAYNGLMNNGTYGRWLGFAYDIRSDAGRSPSPWADLSNFNKFTLGDYDFEVNRELFIHHYQAIFRANQVVDNVPGISMDATLRSRLVGEAKFIRALLYFNLVSLFGNVPLITATSTPQDLPATAAPAQVYTQIEKDLVDAAAALPTSYSGADVGRATKGAALALLGKVQLQQLKFAEAAASLQQVVAIPGYDLMTNYADNFTSMAENNKESVFEVQFGDRALLASGVRGLNIAKMIGPCGPGYCDGRPTRWFFDQFSLEMTTTGNVDPRRDVTIFSPTSTDVYGRTYVQRYGPTSTEIYFKKYGEYYLSVDQDWDAPINYRVIRYADVLLMLAEALNGQGQTAAAYPHINRVRARAGLAALPAGLTQAQMRDRILHERLLEFGLEGQRWNDLKRYNLLSSVVKADAGTAACPTVAEPYVAGCDAEFSTFITNKSELLPIPQTERNLNPNVLQNPGW